MANLNKVMLIGRMVEDPQSRTFSNGGKVTYFRFATNNRRKNMATGQWEDDPVFLDVKIFNRGEYGKKADLAADRLRKGNLVYLEGRLVQERWETDGQKRSKLVLYADDFQFLEPRGRSEGASAAGEEEFEPPVDAGPDQIDDEIPF